MLVFVLSCLKFTQKYHVFMSFLPPFTPPPPITSDDLLYSVLLGGFVCVCLCVCVLACRAELSTVSCTKKNTDWIKSLDTA